MHLVTGRPSIERTALKGTPISDVRPALLIVTIGFVISVLEPVVFHELDPGDGVFVASAIKDSFLTRSTRTDLIRVELGCGPTIIPSLTGGTPTAGVSKVVVEDPIGHRPVKVVFDGTKAVRPAGGAKVIAEAKEVVLVLVLLQVGPIVTEVSFSERITAIDPEVSEVRAKPGVVVGGVQAVEDSEDSVPPV